MGAARSETAGPAAPAHGIAARAQTFTWVASGRASAYEFQLFRGSRRIYRARVAEPRLYVPAAGKTYALTPGDYRWYVWPVARGATRPAEAATVSATLTIVGART